MGKKMMKTFLPFHIYILFEIYIYIYIYIYIGGGEESIDGDR